MSPPVIRYSSLKILSIWYSWFCPGILLINGSVLIWEIVYKRVSLIASRHLKCSAEITVFMCKQAEALSGMVFILALELSGILWTLNLSLSHLVKYIIVGIPFVYFDYMLESCWLKTRNFVRSLNVCLFVFFLWLRTEKSREFHTLVNYFHSALKPVALYLTTKTTQ